jgi:uncharacterized protein
MIGIMSDSHDNLNAVRDAVRLFRAAGCDLIIHAGDFVAPFAALELRGAGCTVQAVFGNCDGEKEGLCLALRPFGKVGEAPLVLKRGGRRILVTHLNGLIDRYVAEGKSDVVIYGHTHRAEIRRTRNTLIINPGETGGWITEKRTIALYDPATNSAEIVGIR